MSVRPYTGQVSTVDAGTPDLRDYLRLIRRRGWIMLLCVALIPIGTYKYTQTLPKTFQARTIVQPQASVDSSLIGSSSPSSASSNINAVAAFISTSAVSDEAARRLGLPVGSLLGAAQAFADPDTGFLTITATAPTARRAIDVANAFAAALNATREKRGLARINAAITAAQQNLKKTPASDIATRGQLTAQLQQLGALRQAQAQNVQVLQPAIGAAQTAPHPSRNATVAVILALLVGAGLIVLAERFDRRLRRPEDLEQLTGLPFLATIPHAAFPGTESTPDVPEAFQTLRNSLTYFNADGSLHSLVIASALKGEGKTTVAVNLAMAFASFGKRVILVDTDLRKPDLENRLGLGRSTGVSDILAGTSSVEDALIDIQPYGHALRVLPAGPVPPNPSALIGSLRMASLLDELGDDADLVILDTTPLLMVSDAFPLLDKVSGVLALARLDKTPRDAIRRMVHITTSAGAQVLGMVATDGKRRRATGYGYGYGYGSGYGEAEKRSAGKDGEAGASGSNGVADLQALPEDVPNAAPARGRLFRRS